MSSVLKSAKAAWAILAAMLAISKAIADYRRHGTHGKHSQRCRCLGNCSFCSVSVAVTGGDGEPKITVP